MSSAPTPPLLPPATLAPAVPAPAPAGDAPCWDSQTLLAGRREALIAHAGGVYRLRITAAGKLILTK